MGISILELVIRRLREEGFQADGAYPGQKFPPITGPTAAVHIQRVDRAALSVTVEVSILCSAAMGGAACELEALRATEVLRRLGAVCVQNGCRYDAVAQVYVVPVLAEFTAVTGMENYTMGPGFHVYINEINQPGVLSFVQEERETGTPEYVMGESDPAAVLDKGSLWDIQLEELIPPGVPEPQEPEEGFQLKVITDLKTQMFFGCRFSSVRREFTRQGIRRIRKGTAEFRRDL